MDFVHVLRLMLSSRSSSERAPSKWNSKYLVSPADSEEMKLHFLDVSGGDLQVDLPQVRLVPDVRNLFQTSA